MTDTRIILVGTNRGASFHMLNLARDMASVERVIPILKDEGKRGDYPKRRKKGRSGQRH